MRQWHLAMLGIVLLLGVCFSGYQSQAAAAPAEPASQVKEEDRLPIYPRDQWRFMVSPYIWIPGISGTVNSLRSSVDTNIPWWDMASRLFSNTIGVMGRAEAWKGRWGLFLDGYYCYLGVNGSAVGANREKSLGPGLLGNVSGNITLTPSGDASYISRIVGLDVGGRFLVGTWPMEAGQQFPVLSLEVLGGLRFNSFNQFLKIYFSRIRVGAVNANFPNLSLSDSHQTIKGNAYTLNYTLQVFEPFIGPRMSIWLGPKVVLSFKGTVGGFGLVAYNNLTCDLEALLGYRVNQAVYAYGGYRARGTWFSFGEGHTKVSVNGWFNGPVLGFAYMF